MNSKSMRFWSLVLVIVMLVLVIGFVLTKLPGTAVDDGESDLAVSEEDNRSYLSGVDANDSTIGTNENINVDKTFVNRSSIWEREKDVDLWKDNAGGESTGCDITPMISQFASYAQTNGRIAAGVTEQFLLMYNKVFDAATAGETEPDETETETETETQTEPQTEPEPEPETTPVYVEPETSAETTTYPENLNTTWDDLFGDCFATIDAKIETYLNVRSEPNGTVTGMLYPGTGGTLIGTVDGRRLLDIFHNVSHGAIQNFDGRHD